MVRHGARVHEKKVADKDSPLTPAGKKQAAELTELLHNRGIHCNVFLSSNYAHALETPGILAERSPGAPIRDLCAFTPHSGRETLKEIVAEIDRAGLNRSKLGVIAFVGHERPDWPTLCAADFGDHPAIGKLRSRRYIG